ncbi:MAG TPA: protein kinase [Polyangiaceae bacterium]|jgi:serine/threonine-protein kinase
MQCDACQHPNVDGARFCANCGAILPAKAVEGSDPMIGQLIGGRYRVTGVLGEGGMGIVYVGEQQMGSTVRKVAIKTLHAHLSKDPSVLARFHRECGTVAQLEHPNTIKFYDFGSTSDGTLYIAMEFVAGQPLSELIQHGPLSVDRVIKIMRQVCGALDEAHMQGIIHRDLKPENLVLTDRAGETDFVKVLDFGIAARTESADAHKEQKLTQQGMVLGTPPYMSPEQFTGKALDARSDIYSLGVMTYEMLAGRLPFDADTPWQWATQHMNAQPIPFEVSAPSKSIPDGMRHAILRALSKDREARQATAREFFSELSDGGRMTVEQAHDSSSTGTAAMAAVPNFTPPVVAAQMAAPVAAVPPGPVMSRDKSGGGKGLIVGLGVVGGILLLAIVVVAAKSLKKDDGPQVLTPPSVDSSSTGVTTIAPIASSPADTAPTAPIAPSSAGPVEPVHPIGGGTGPVVSKPPVALSGSAACDACLTAAASGNITSAASDLQRCDDSAKKQRCVGLVKSSAPGAAKSAAFNGNCAGAKAIVAAAQGIGASTGALNNALRATSCK